MSLLIDFFPLLLFFVVFKIYDIFAATAVAIVASAIQIAYLYWHKKLAAVHWLSLAIIVIFGGATLLLHDEAFIKWKPTVLYVAFALVLAAGKLIWQRDLLRYVMKGIELPDRVWNGLTWAWTTFFAFLAVLNWLVAFHLGFSTDTWVTFKVWGILGIMLLFVLGQGLVLVRYLPQEEPQEKP
ncbi:MAG: septation protein A [Proteobacteria bacterium]|nr:septation protein A [Pseudomonadota bacterium]MCL2308375.1 septation protein A [Pseudomonadota bacterium]